MQMHKGKATAALAWEVCARSRNALIWLIGVTAVFVAAEHRVQFKHRSRSKRLPRGRISTVDIHAGDDSCRGCSAFVFSRVRLHGIGLADRVDGVALTPTLFT